MRKLDVYVLREMILPFLIGTLVIVLMFQANTYIWLAKNFNLENIPVTAQFQFILYQTPSFLKMTLPAGTALAASLAITRLTRESELTAIRAAGARILRVVAPIIFFGALVGVANFYIVDRVIPTSTRKANEIAQANAFLGMSSSFKNNSLIQLDRFAASFGTVARSADEVLTISDVMLIERSEANISSIITARSGTYYRGVWHFPGAAFYRVSGNDIVAAKSDDVTIRQEINFDQFFNQGSQGLTTEETPTPELQKQIRAAIQSKVSSPRPYEVELQQRFAVPAACAIFALTSSVFAVAFGRSGGFAGVLISFVIVLLYYNAFVISNQIFGKMEAVPPWLAAWLPNIVFGVLGLIGIRRLE